METTITSPRLPEPKPAQSLSVHGGECGVLLRAMDWENHPFGPPEHWPSMLKSMTNLVLRSKQPMFLTWGPEYLCLYNDGFAQICGDRHPVALGGKLFDAWYEVQHVFEPINKRVYAGEAMLFEDMAVWINRNSAVEQAYFTLSYSPLEADDGKIQGMLCVCNETTKEVMLQRELVHERDRLGGMFQEAPSFMAMLSGPDHVMDYANASYIRLVGRPVQVGIPVAKALPEIASQGYIDMLDAVRATGQAIKIDGAKVSLLRQEGAASEDRFVDFVFQPMLNLAGEVTGIFAEGIDVTERIQALEDLTSSEQFLQSVLGASSDCIKVLDLEAHLIFMSSGGKQIMEVPKDKDIQGAFWPEFWQGEGRDQALQAVDAARNGKPATFQGFADTFAGNARFWDVRVTPILDQSGNPERILAVSRDISYLKTVEQEREHLLQELSHRLKNAFTMVQSIIRQTLRQSDAGPAAREVLLGRVQALSAAQDILTRSVLGNMPLRDVIGAALLPHRTGEGRFSLEGPDAIISGRQGLGLSLALHELCTNAVKYGALSNATGKVAIAWQTQDGGTFSFEWRETGGPVVRTPDHSGFGSILIEKIVATYFDGSAKLVFDALGVTFHLEGNISNADSRQEAEPY